MSHLNIKPFLGRLKVEAIEGNSVEHLTELLKKKVGAEQFESAQKAGIILDDPEIFRETVDVRTDQHSGNTVKMLGRSRVEDKLPLNKGKILEIAEDSFGERFSDHYGQDSANIGKRLKVGDIVYFVPNGTFKLDSQGKYHIIADEHIVGYEQV